MRMKDWNDPCADELQGAVTGVEQRKLTRTLLDKVLGDRFY